MATIKSVLEKVRASPPDKILLHKEGVFWKAYEQSAMKIYECVRHCMLKRKNIKIVGYDVVSAGFPLSSLESWAGTRQVCVTEEWAEIVLSKEETGRLPKFEVWKNSVPNSAGNKKSEELLSENCDQSDSVLRRISVFPVESKTLVETWTAFTASVTCLRLCCLTKWMRRR